MGDKKKISNSFWVGIIIISVGGFILLDRMDIVFLPYWLFSWRTFLIALGLIIGINKRFRGVDWLVLIIIGSIKTFDLFWVMTEGGPSHATELIATWMYRQAFRGTNWGYGAALAFAMFLIAFAFAIVFMLITRQQMKSVVPDSLTPND